MKLAKKMLASVMALAMIAALALTAFAAAPVLVVSTEEYASVGDTVTVAISAKDIAGLESGSLVVSFDAAALKVVNADDAGEISAPADAKYDMGMGGNTSEGVVTWAVIYLKAATEDSALLNIEFEVLAEGDHTVAVVAEDWAGADLPAEVSVVIAEKEETTAAPTTAAPTTAAPTTAAPTEATSEAPTQDEIPQTGEAGVAAIAGVMALAAVAFVATRKKDEE